MEQEWKHMDSGSVFSNLLELKHCGFSSLVELISRDTWLRTQDSNAAAVF